PPHPRQIDSGQSGGWHPGTGSRHRLDADGDRRDMSRFPAGLAARVVTAWETFWFDEIPPHVYAFLRILVGLIVVGTLIGLHDSFAFWDPDGFVPLDDAGVKALLLSHGLGWLAGRILYLASLASFASMAIGLKSTMSVALALITSLLQLSWNYL